VVTAALLLLLAQPTTDPAPAFLDDADLVTVALASPVAVPEASGFQVRVEGVAVPIRLVEPGEDAPRPIDPDRVVLPGTIQQALGGSEWDPNGETTEMTPLDNGRFQFVARFPAGRYEYKVAQGGTWEKNWGAGFVAGGPNITLDVPAGGAIVRFVVDLREGWVRDSINQPALVPPPTASEITRREPTPKLVGSVRLRLARPLTQREMTGDVRVLAGGQSRRVYGRHVFDRLEFRYAKDDLGVTEGNGRLTFKVWSPAATHATLLIDGRRVAMNRGTAGVWYATVAESARGQQYRFEFLSYGRRRTASDLYGRASTRDSMTSIVMPKRSTEPAAWPPTRAFTGQPTDAVIYEMHVRDCSIHPSSGVPEPYRGKYAGLTGPGLDYLRNLGVTHVHLLPIHDFNPEHSNAYNWGYETTQFNVPEEQYAVGTDPFAAQRELRQVISAYANAGIGIVLDVVYNHSVPSEGERSAFWETMPFYYFRTNDRGDVLNESGVGNALADERFMVRKFVRDSLVYWTREYRVAGFRFDLLGMHNPESVREWVAAVRAENPHALIYGEPWTGGGPLRFPKGAQQGMGIAVFNDHFRGAVRGNLDAPGPGFMTGGFDRLGLTRAVTGSIPFNQTVSDFAASPAESVNYVSAHDNLTLLDRVALDVEGEEEQQRSVRLALATVLLSQGVPFIEGGSEMGRTKNGNHNSYNGGDAINQFDWARGQQFRTTTEYVRGLIALRKAHPAFRLATTEEVRRSLTFLDAPEGVLAFRLDGRASGDGWNEIVVVLNGRGTTRVPLTGRWNVVVEGDKAGTETLRTAEGAIDLQARSATVVWR
jgi:pullulanase